MNYNEICNMAFVKYAKVTSRDVLLIPAVNKQLGKVWNYIIVAAGPYNGVYKYDAVLTDTFKVWKNKTLDCYIIPINKVTKIKELSRIDPKKPLGGYITRVLRKLYGQE